MPQTLHSLGPSSHTPPQEQEREALQRLYSAGSLKRLRREGLVLTGLSASPSGELYRSALWTFTPSTPDAFASSSSSSSPSSTPRTPWGAPGGAGPASGFSQGRASGFGGAAGQGRAELAYHKFRVGDSLLVTRWDTHSDTANSSSNGDRVLSRAGGNGGGSGGGGGGQSPAVVMAGAVEGTLLEVRRGTLVVAFELSDAEALEAAVSEQPRATWRLDHIARDTTTQRQVDAIHRLAEFGGGAAAGARTTGAGAGAGAGAADAAASERLIRCVLVGTRSAALLAEQPPAWVRSEAWRSDARDALAALTGLNSSQRRAVAKAMVSSLTLWQGPPGTGKTRTLLALLQVLVGTTAKSGARQRAMGTVLACADTNAAVDNLVRGLLARGIRVVRVGSPAKVSPELRHLTLEAQAEATREGRVAVAKRDAARSDLQQYAAMRAAPMEDEARRRLGAAEAGARAVVAEADAVLREAQQEVLDAAQVRGGYVAALG